jgi:hypothetical protein
MYAVSVMYLLPFFVFMAMANVFTACILIYTVLKNSDLALLFGGLRLFWVESISHEEASCI